MTGLTKRAEREMAKEYRDGATLGQLVSTKKLGINRVREILVQNGVEIRRPGSSVGRDDERLAIMKKMYSDHTLQEIGNQFGLSRERVRQILAAAGVKSRDIGPRPHRLSEDEGKIAKQYEQGMSPSEIMIEHNLSYYTLRSILKRAGVELKPKGFFVRGPECDQADKMIADYYNDMKIKDIAIKYGFPAPTKVYQILRRHGITPNRHKVSK